MKVRPEDVLYVSELANLELTDAERERMLRDLNSILGYIERLNQLDTAGVPPMAQVSAGIAPDSAMRPDQTRPSIPREDALRNAPQNDGEFFKVPKVIEK
jgi:aspartyl-tRNA(Asn)/glutamyl-tRNA(Gln) amidotransferase subunit C